MRVVQAAAPPAGLSARGADLYKAKVADLEASLNDPAIKVQAADALRRLIDQIVLTPDAAALDGLAAELHGDLAMILHMAEPPPAATGGGRRGAAVPQNDKHPRTFVPGCKMSVVAGTRFELMTFRL